MRIFYLLCLFLSLSGLAQRKVLMEEFTGAHCGNCPMGSYYVDSMQAKYPALIPIALHSYPIYDAMNFAQIDTLFTAYSTGSPMAAIDRINPGGASTNTGIFYSQWDSKIQQRLAITPSVNVSLNASWNGAGRVITSNITVNVSSNMANGDYRIGMYVVEDSVTGTGSGYDQSNLNDTGPPGNPFFGMGDPIVGYVHRHVARAMLPTAWSLNNLLPASPAAGQTFTCSFSYTLPVQYNENRVHLVAFVNKITLNHAADEILNAQSIKLLAMPSALVDRNKEPDAGIYYDFSNDLLHITSATEISKVEIFNVGGKKVCTENLQSKRISLPANHLNGGLYLVRIDLEGRTVCRKIVLDK